MSFVSFPHTHTLNLYRVCREQWIRAKYERKEFVLEATDDERPYTIGTFIINSVYGLIRTCLRHGGGGGGGGGVG